MLDITQLIAQLGHDPDTNIPRLFDKYGITVEGMIKQLPEIKANFDNAQGRDKDFVGGFETVFTAGFVAALEYAEVYRLQQQVKGDE